MGFFGPTKPPLPKQLVPPPGAQLQVGRPIQHLNPKILEAKRKRAVARFQKGMLSLTDVIAPSSIEVDFRSIRVGEKFYRTFFVVGYPRYVSPNWLQPLIDFDHTVDIAMYVYPTSAADVLTDLRRKIAEMEATIASDIDNGKPADPKVSAALEDALSVQEQLAKGVERFFQFSLYITISAENMLDLEETSKRLHTTLSALLMVAKTATLQMEDGFKSTVPLGLDRLYLPRNMDTTSLASTFPFSSAMLTQDRGILYGINEQNGSLIIFDRYSLENANEVVLGKSGAGKSYLIKLEIMRQFMFGTEVIVVDPEGEYSKLANTVGGEVVEFTPSSPVKINPFDLSGLYEEGENELGLKILSLHALLKIVMGSLDPGHDAILDRALVETYRQKGVTTDPSTQKLEPPLMEDLYKVLIGMEDPSAKDLALRLEKFIKGSIAGIFNQQSNFDIKNPLTTFSIRQLEDELRPIAMHIILDFVWTKIRKSLKKRLLILDEAWYMMRYEDSASFVYGLAKRARKYFLGLTTATQDVEDFLSTEYGKAVLSNSSIQMLLKQGTAEVDLIAKTFYLSEAEKELLLSADVGEGLFFAGQSHVAMKVVAAPFEHSIITSNPQELLNMEPPPPQLTPSFSPTPEGSFIQPLPIQQTQTLPPLSPPPAPFQPAQTKQEGIATQGAKTTFQSTSPLGAGRSFIIPGAQNPQAAQLQPIALAKPPISPPPTAPLAKPTITYFPQTTPPPPPPPFQAPRPAK